MHAVLNKSLTMMYLAPKQKQKNKNKKRGGKIARQNKTKNKKGGGGEGDWSGWIKLVYPRIYTRVEMQGPLGYDTKHSCLKLVECCFTSTETVGLLGTGAQDVHLDFHTAPEL